MAPPGSDDDVRVPAVFNAFQQSLIGKTDVTKGYFEKLVRVSYLLTPAALLTCLMGVTKGYFEELVRRAPFNHCKVLVIATWACTSRAFVCRAELPARNASLDRIRQSGSQQCFFEKLLRRDCICLASLCILYMFAWSSASDAR